MKTICTYSNPMYFILNRQDLGVNNSLYIIILKEFELEFAKSSSKKTLVFVKLCLIFPILLRNCIPLIHFLMNISSLLVQLTRGMHILFCISMHIFFNLVCLMKNIVVSATTPSTILSLMYIVSSWR